MPAVRVIVSGSNWYGQLMDESGTIGAIGPFSSKDAAVAACRRVVRTVIMFCGSTIPAFVEDDPCMSITSCGIEPVA